MVVFITALLFLKDLLLNESMILFIAGFTLIRRVLSGTRMKVGLALCIRFSTFSAGLYFLGM